jgi:hypothetical protein
MESGAPSMSGGGSMPNGAAAPSQPSQPSSGGESYEKGPFSNGNSEARGQEREASKAYDDGYDPEERSEADAESEREQRAEEARKWRLKRKGAEIELAEEDMIRYASMGFDANDKWQEAAKIRAQNAEFIKLLQENPRAVLAHPKLGLDLKQMAYDILYEDLQTEMMSPEEKEAFENKRKLSEYEERERERAEYEAQARREAEDRQYQEATDRQIREAFTGAKIPITQFTYDSIINYMGEALKAGHYNVTPQDVMPLVQADFEKAIREVFTLPFEDVYNLVGEDTFQKLQQGYIAKARGRREPEAREPRQAARQASEPKLQKATSLEEWRDQIRKRWVD